MNKLRVFQGVAKCFVNSLKLEFQVLFPIYGYNLPFDYFLLHFCFSQGSL